MTIKTKKNDKPGAQGAPRSLRLTGEDEISPTLAAKDAAKVGHPAKAEADSFACCRKLRNDKQRQKQSLPP
jgi:hypothetical protein